MEKSGTHASKHQTLIRTLADPVAEVTDWRPMSSGGSSFQMLEFVETSGERIEFRRTRGMIGFYRGLMGMGLVLLGLAAFVASTSRYVSAEDSLYLTSSITLTGLVVGGIGIAMKRFASRPSVVDRRLGWYWKGAAPRDSADVERRRDAVLLNEVHAVQILAKWFDGRDSESGVSTPYTSYELNLVMHDGSRINVINHGGHQARSIFSDAARLSKFINVPLWNAS